MQSREDAKNLPFFFLAPLRLLCERLWGQALCRVKAGNAIQVSFLCSPFIRNPSYFSDGFKYFKVMEKIRQSLYVTA
jgi:hypothetical protein